MTRNKQPPRIVRRFNTWSASTAWEVPSACSHVCYLGGFLTISVAVAFPYLHSKITGRTCNFGYFSNPCEIQKEIDSGG